MIKPPQRDSQNHTEKSYPHQELTKIIIGGVFDVFKSLGYGYQEKYYQRALAKHFAEIHLSFDREKLQTISYHGCIIGRYFMDFVVQDTVVVELKVATDFHETHMKQLLGYMRAGNFPIGLLCKITPDGVRVKRFVI